MKSEESPAKHQLELIQEQGRPSMHITTIVAFALLFARSEVGKEWFLVGSDDVVITLSLCLIGPLGVGLAALVSKRRICRLMDGPDAPAEVAQHAHLRAMFLLRTAALTAFAALVLLTPWCDWLTLKSTHPALQIFADWAVLSPFLVSNLLLWTAAHGAESALRSGSGQNEMAPSPQRKHTLGAYLDFQFRHQFLIVAVPLSLILFASNVTKGYSTELIAWTRWPWTPDVALAACSILVFVCAPVLLRRIWRTRPLEDGPLRERLERLCKRIDLNVREILVWHSDGLMVNAAVMGLFAPVRFVLLSDALLTTMTPEQVEAVFGHEAGHVRHRHIPHFLVFAFVGWLIVAGIMELLARTWTNAAGELTVSALTIQGIGIGATMIFWALGFGWLSRRFEWQADLFGASCVTPDEGQCAKPCSVHLDESDGTVVDNADRVCATGAAIFASALRRVAVLNGIPIEERSWRHSSIGNRVRFLASVAGDPGRAIRFQRNIRRTKRVMMGCAVVGGAISVVYCLVMLGFLRR